MLVAHSVMEQRYEAVMAVLRDGEPVTEVAARFGVSHQVFSVGANLAGKLVTVHIEDDLLHVWAEGARIRTVLRTSRGEVRKKRARSD